MHTELRPVIFNPALGTQRCPDYSKLLPPLTRAWSKIKSSAIFLLKVDLLNLESQNQTNNIPVGLPSSPIKIWGKSVQSFLSYDRTNKKISNKYNFIFKDADLLYLTGEDISCGDSEDEDEDEQGEGEEKDV